MTSVAAQFTAVGHDRSRVLAGAGRGRVRPASLGCRALAAPEPECARRRGTRAQPVLEVVPGSNCNEAPPGPDRLRGSRTRPPRPGGGSSARHGPQLSQPGSRGERRQVVRGRRPAPPLDSRPPAHSATARTSSAPVAADREAEAVESSGRPGRIRRRGTEWQRPRGRRPRRAPASSARKPRPPSRGRVAAAGLCGLDSSWRRAEAARASCSRCLRPRCCCWSWLRGSDPAGAEWAAAGGSPAVVALLGRRGLDEWRRSGAGDRLPVGSLVGAAPGEDATRLSARPRVIERLTAAGTRVELLVDEADMETGVALGTGEGRHCRRDLTPAPAGRHLTPTPVAV